MYICMIRCICVQICYIYAYSYYYYPLLFFLCFYLIFTPYFTNLGAIYMHRGQQYIVVKLDLVLYKAHVLPTRVDYYTTCW